MAKLSEEIQRYVVQQLACYVGPTEIQADVKETFGVEVSKQAIHRYDPIHGNPAPKWRALHAASRTAFLAETSAIGIAQPAFRLRELDRLYRKVAGGARPNIPLAKDLLVEAEKFDGKLYTNRRELTGKGGEPIVGAVEVRFVRPKKDEGDADA